MHSTVLVFTVVNNIVSRQKSNTAIMEEALEDANMYLDPYVGFYFDYYDSTEGHLKTFLTTKTGEKCQACRITDFKEFQEGLPYDMVRGGYISAELLDKYGVAWETVVDRELKDALEDDNPPDSQCWLVAVDIHF